jgi:hypothetical protein
VDSSVNYNHTSPVPWTCCHGVGCKLTGNWRLLVKHRFYWFDRNVANIKVRTLLQNISN